MCLASDGRCRFPLILSRPLCECCADCHGYLMDSTWLVKFIVLSQEGFYLGFLVWMLKHVEVKGCDKLLCKPVGARSPEAHSNTRMVISLVSHFCHMILFLSIGFHYCTSPQIPGWLARVTCRQPQLSVTRLARRGPLFTTAPSPSSCASSTSNTVVITVMLHGANFCE